MKNSNGTIEVEYYSMMLETNFQKSRFPNLNLYVKWMDKYSQNIFFPLQHYAIRGVFKVNFRKQVQF